MSFRYSQARWRPLAIALITTSLTIGRAGATDRSSGAASRSAPGVFGVLESNPFYFQDARGKPVVLIGDYTWGIFSDVDYDYKALFESHRARGLNLCRVWVWWGTEEFAAKEARHVQAVHIEPYLRPGPGDANDGRPKYDLTRFSQPFFDRLRDVCSAARERGLVLQLIMVDAWMLKHASLWRMHAYQRDNNVNGVDGDPADTGTGTDGQKGFCSMGNPKVLGFQKACIRKVVETVGEFDNIYFEIANENGSSREWELHLCDFISECEKGKPKRHLVMPRDLPRHGDLVQNWDPGRVHAGMLADRRLKRPLIFDTDWIINRNDDEVRKAMWSGVLSGSHFDYMDDSLPFRIPPGKDNRAQLHKQIDYLAVFVKHIKPWEMPPDDGLVRSGHAFALASAKELAAYLPAGGEITLDLAGIAGDLTARWYDPREGTFREPSSLRGGGRVELSAPDTNDWALLIQRGGVNP
jgi:hypothetical protein